MCKVMADFVLSFLRVLSGHVVVGEAEIPRQYYNHEPSFTK